MWYKLLLACAATTECQTALEEQLPGILQQLQDSGHGTTAFELTRELCRARTCQAKAEAALLKAKANVAKVEAQLQLQKIADRPRLNAVP